MTALFFFLKVSFLALAALLLGLSQAGGEPTSIVLDPGLNLQEPTTLNETDHLVFSCSDPSAGCTLAPSLNSSVLFNIAGDAILELHDVTIIGPPNHAGFVLFGQAHLLLRNCVLGFASTDTSVALIHAVGGSVDLDTVTVTGRQNRATVELNNDSILSADRVTFTSNTESFLHVRNVPAGSTSVFNIANSNFTHCTPSHSHVPTVLDVEPLSSFDGDLSGLLVSNVQGRILWFRHNSGNLVIRDSTFQHNTAANAIGFDGSSSTLEVIDSVFLSNTNTDTSSGAFFYLPDTNDINVTMRDTTIQENTVLRGFFYALRTNNLVLTLERVTVLDNIGTGETTAFQFRNSLDGKLLVEDSSFMGNVGVGGAVLFYWYSTQGSETHFRSAIFRSCNFFDNLGVITSQASFFPYGGPVSFFFAYTDSLLIENCIFSGHSVTGLSEGRGVLYLSRRDFLDVIIRNTSFLDNDATFGAGMNLDTGKINMLLENVTVRNQVSVREGGFINCFRCTFNLTAINSIFEGNKASTTGGTIQVVCNNDCSNFPTLSFSNSSFIRNSAEVAGGVLSIRNLGQATVSFHDCIFEENSVENNGGVLSLSLGNIALSFSGNVVFRNNTAGNGGAIYLAESPLPFSLSSATFFGNSANNGGGLFLDQVGPTTLSDLDFLFNSATFSGGGYFQRDVLDSSAHNLRFVGNTANSGAGFHIAEARDATLEDLDFSLNIGAQGTMTFASSSGTIHAERIRLEQNQNALFGTGVHSGPGIVAKNWTVVGNSDLRTTLSGLGFSMFLFSSFSGNFSISHSLFSNNSFPLGYLFTTSSALGALSISDSEFISNSGGLLASSNTALFSLERVKLHRNIAFNPSAVSHRFFWLTDNSEGTVSDCEFLDNDVEILWEQRAGSTNVISNSVFQATRISSALFFVSLGSLELSQVDIEQPQVPGEGSCLQVSVIGSLSLTDSSLSQCNSLTSNSIANLRDQARLTIHNSTVKNTNVSEGAAFQATDSSVVSISDSTFSHLNNGGLLFSGSRVRASIQNSKFLDSSSETQIPVYLWVSQQANLTVTSSELRNGETLSSGCVRVDYAILVLEDTEVVGCSSGRQGAALQLVGFADVRVRSSRFHGNRANDGGVVSLLQLYLSSVVFDSCSFESNWATDGAVLFSAIDRANTVLFLASTFLSNSAARFGGIFVSSDSSVITFRGCLFEENTAHSAGIGYEDWDSATIFEDSSFLNNSAVHEGGAFHLEKSSRLDFLNSTLSGTHLESGLGGVIFMTSSAKVMISSSTFLENSSPTSGGVIGATSPNLCELRIENSVFQDNSAQEKGGAISFAPSQEDRLVLTNTSFIANSAAFGGALSIETVRFFPSLASVTFESNAAAIFGQDVHSPPSALRAEASGALEGGQISMLSGAELPAVHVELLDSLGQPYTLTPQPVLTLYLRIAPAPSAQPPPPAAPYLTGVTSLDFGANGTLSFSAPGSRVRAFGLSGNYVLNISTALADPFYPATLFSLSIPLLFPPCTNGFTQAADLSCRENICSVCPSSQGAVCVAPGNCTCPPSREGLACELLADRYDSIKLVFTALPALPKKRSSTISVELRDHILVELEEIYRPKGLTVRYRAFYQEGPHFVFKYSLSRNATFVEGPELEKLALLATEPFGLTTTPLTVQAEAQVMQFSDPLVIAVVVLSAILIVLTLGTAAVMVVKRETPVIKAASPLYCTLILLGILLAYLTFLPYIGTPSRVSCMAPVVMGPLAFSLVFGNLLAKTFRIYRIFTNTKMRVSPPSNKLLMLFSGIIVGVEMILVLAWLVASPPVPSRMGPEEARFFTCSSPLDATMTSVIMAYNGALLLLGSYLAIMTRKAFTAFRESQLIGLSIYTLTTFAVAVLPVLFGVELQLTTQFALRSFAVLIVTTTTLVLLFGSKMFIILFQPEKNTTAYFNERFLDPSSTGHHPKFFPQNSASRMNSSIELNTLTPKTSALILLCEEKPWSQWKKKYAVQYGDFFGFFDDIENADANGGLHPISHWSVEKTKGDQPILRLTLASKKYLFQAKDEQDAIKWMDILMQGRRGSMQS